MKRTTGIGIVAIGLVMIQSACQAPDPYHFERPLIYSVNPVGNGSFVGARSRGSNFVSYQTLIFERCQEIGSRSARVLASWREIEARKGDWDWSDLDREIADCERYGIKPVVLIVNIPAWVSPTGKPAHDYAPKEENANDFNTFITRLATRYKGRARYYEFWNEQNGFGWHVDKVDGRFRYNRADEYIPWLYRCYKVIKAVDPEAQVSMGGLDNAEGYAPIFVRMAYEMRRDMYHGETFWDAIADHPYNKKAHETDDRAIEKLEAIRAVAAEFGDDDISMWITEYGWNPNDTSAEAQERGTRAFLHRFAAPEQGYLKIAQQLAMADFEPVHQGYGLCNLNLKPTPAFYAFQEEARPLEPGLHDLTHTLQPSGTVTLQAWRRGVIEPGGALHVEILDENGTPLARKKCQDDFSASETADNGAARPSRADRRAIRAEFSNLLRGVPLLACFHYVIKGHHQPPIARLPIILPTENAAIANGDFEGLFRSGVPWGWRIRNDLIVRNGSILGPDYVHSGNESLLVVLFDNHEPYQFNERLETPLKARQGERYRIKGHARLQSSIEEDAHIRIIPRLIAPYGDMLPEGDGTLITKDWTPFETIVKSPTDAPLLAFDLHSPPLPRSSDGRKQRWIIVLDQITADRLEPSG